MTEAQRDEFVPTYRRDRDRGAGLGLPFAKRLVEATGVPVGLIPAAHGGTNMEQWDPAKRTMGGNSLYGSMLRQVKAAGGRVAGVLWFQGESEGFETEPSPFLDRFLALVTAVRFDFDAPELPFLYVQIGRAVMPGIPSARWTEIRELQRQALGRLKHAAMVTAVDLPLEDGIHIATPGLKVLGTRLAGQALRLLGRDRKTGPGPGFRSAEPEGEKRDQVRVWFDGCNGDLAPDRLVRGFSIRDAAGKDLEMVFEAMPDPRQPGSVLVLLRAPVPDGSFLFYGWGTDPACNLADSAGCAAPAFGPVPL
jgi:sialate O-acetylesterase